jgi:hypothetical protein
MTIFKCMFFLCFLVTIATPAAAQPAAATEPEVAAAPAAASKKCLSASRKVEREQRALTAAVESIAKDRKGHESCSTKSMCSRYDAAIDTMEKRKSRHETRLTRFKEDAEKACKPS